MMATPAGDGTSRVPVQRTMMSQITSRHTGTISASATVRTRCMVGSRFVPPGAGSKFAAGAMWIGSLVLSIVVCKLIGRSRRRKDLNEAGIDKGLVIRQLPDLLLGEHLAAVV